MKHLNEKEKEIMKHSQIRKKKEFFFFEYLSNYKK